MTVAAIVAAAGRGERLGASVPKALVPVGGLALVAHATRMLAGSGVDVVVVVAPPDAVDEVAAVVPDATVIAGGDTRQASVRLALATLSPVVDVVLVHDAARGLAPESVARAVLAAIVAGADAVVPVLPMTDTVKEVAADGSVRRTLDRSSLRAVQTPQGFRRTVLDRAHRDGDAAATDDAALVEALGVRVMTVPGSPAALKVTTAADIALAEQLLAARGDRVR